LKLNRDSLWRLLALLLVVSYGLLAGCSSPVAEGETAAQTETGILALPTLETAELNSEPLLVVATTSIIGDVVAQVGGDAIVLTTLMGPGQDPHSYEPGARELTAVADADVIFVNGWNLEEGLIDDLKNIGGDAPLVPISAHIQPLTLGKEAEHEEEDEEHKRGGVDPHVWLSIQNVEQWVENTRRVLSALDPANADTYASNAEAYMAELDALKTYTKTELAKIPEEKRFLVTNHESLGYFAHEYGFELVGTVIPNLSTIAEPSASDLAGLIAEMKAHGVCTIFTESTVNDTLAQTVARELEECAAVQVQPLYTGAVGPAGSGADSYLGMFRANVDVIVTGLTN